MNADLELQGAIVGRLRGDPGMTALVQGRVFDIVPLDAVFPYVSYGPSDTLSDDAECITGLDLSLQIDVWSREVGYPECKRIADAVRAALHGAETALALPTNALALIEHRQTRTFRDPDGLTSHAAVTFNAFVESQ